MGTTELFAEAKTRLEEVRRANMLSNERLSQLHAELAELERQEREVIEGLTFTTAK